MSYSQVMFELLYRTELWVSITAILLAGFIWRALIGRKEPPGPWGLPIVGYMPFLGRQMYKGLTDLSKRYGDVFQVRIGTRKIVVVNGQRAIREALLQKNTDFAGRPDFFSYTAIPNFGFSTYSQTVRVHKKLTLKAFRSFSKERRLELQQVGHKAAHILFDAIKAADGEPFDPEETLYKATCSVIGYICYGKHFDSNSPEVDTILKSAKDFADAVTFGVLCDYIPWARFLVKGRLERLKKVLLRLKEFSNKMAAPHIDTYDGKSIRDVSDTFHSVCEEMDETEKCVLEVDDKLLKDTVSDMFGAGFGTIAETVRYGIKVMAMYPDIQRQVQEEIDHVIGRDRLPGIDDIKDVPYTAAVISEIYRYQSMSALAVTHAAMCDTELDGYFIAKGTPVIINLYSAHHDPSIFKNHTEFDPSRFLTPEGKLDSKKVNYVIPYGLGHRRCGGEIIGRLEIILLFQTILQRCSMKEAPGHPLDPEDSILTFGVIQNPFKVILRPRYDNAFDL